jgi:N-acetylglutamate synthase-like GNAT family acetyltransferase
MTKTTTSLRWVREDDPRWDADKERVFATIPAHVFPALPRITGKRLSSDWWHVERDGRVIAYGWLDDVWGDAEILLAVEEEARGSGAGRYVLDHLEQEADARGLRYVVNVVREGHPQRDAVQAWFLAHGFHGTDDGRLRKKVGDRAVAERRPGPADDARRARYAAERDRAAARPHAPDAPSGGDVGPGAEESGGYVDPEHHRY